MQFIINKHINRPNWVSETPIKGLQRESALFAWLGHNKFADMASKTHKITMAEKISDKGLFGNYYIQAIFSADSDQNAFLVVIDSKSHIIDNFIFDLNDFGSTAQKVRNAIINREEIIVRNILIKIKQNYDRDNVQKLIKIFKALNFNPFNEDLKKHEINFIKFVFDFGFNFFVTSEEIDFRKMNFVLERLNNPWSEIELKTILQLVDQYQIIKKIRDFEDVFEKIGGIRNLSLVLHRGKLHGDLFEVARRTDLKQDQLLQAINETKQIIKRLGL
jgi:hypothetical protein